MPILLGREFLNLFSIGLRFCNFKLKKTCQLKFKLKEPNKLKAMSYYCESNVIDFSRFQPSHDQQPTPDPVIDKVCVSRRTLKAPDECGHCVFSVYPVLDDDCGYDIGSGFGDNARKFCRELIKRVYVKVNPSAVVSHPHVMKIRLTSDLPLYCSPRRLAYSDRLEVDKMVSELLKEGIIRPSNSPYASPIVLVRKKNGDRRMCIDYRGLNKITVRDNFPLPLIDYCLEYLDGKDCFSVLDLKNGFHQVKMEEESVQYTSFVTPSGQYEYVRMPFGLKNGPSVFQRFITDILRDMIEASEIVVYMDDILLATVGSENHFRLLEKLLTRLAAYNLEIKVSKCSFLQERIDYLGYSADKSGIKPNDSHINAIKNYPMPTNAREVQSCLGLFSYFRRFVPSFSRIAGPLLNILRSTDSFKIDDACRHSFASLRDALIAAPVLAIYNHERETDIHTDASSHGFGAVLLQKQSDHKFHPVAYYSRRTSPTESRYHSFELETLAVIMALRRFGPIIGTKKAFQIITDCNALTLTLAKKDINPKISRWVFEIEQYNYTIAHRKGSSMGHVDALSRCHPVVATVSTEEIDLHLQATQSRDHVISEICRRLEKEPVENFELCNGLVYRKLSDTRSALYVPSEMEDNVIRLVHEKACHLSVDKCYDQIRLHYWFPSMHRKIVSFVQNCIRCIMHNPPTRVNQRHLHSIPKEPVPFDTLHIDHLGPLSQILNKNKHILVVIDAFTKFVKLYPVNTTSTKEVCLAMQKYFDYYSRPRRIVSDRGTCFTSSEFASFLSDRNVIHVKNAVASPQANGQVERVNRVLTAMLGKISNPVNHADWSRLLTNVEHAINNTVHSTTQQMPSVLLFGIPQRGRIVDELTEYLEDRTVIPVDIAVARSEASNRIELSQTRNEIQYGRRSVSPSRFQEGDFVVIRNVDTTVGRNKKLIPKYRGPYRIHRVLPNDRYVVRDIDTCQVTQIPYNGVLEAARLKLWVKAKEQIISACYGDSGTLARPRSACSSGGPNVTPKKKTTKRANSF